ncbi:MAG: DedA family protein [Acidobacteria bacterium]|nr:DedA family protein [Acidobacteriota bacterium]
MLGWVSAYGPVALSLLLLLGIVGLPVPDETLLVFSGYLISRGTFSAPTTWAAAALGSISGITISFLLGRTLGLHLIHRYGRRFGATGERIERVHQWFRGVGHWGLTFGYYVPGVRHFTALVAGASHLEWATFTLYAWSGAVLWVSTFLAVGYLLGEQWRRAVDHAHQLLLVASVVAVLAAVVYFLRRKSRKSGTG